MKRLAVWALAIGLPACCVAARTSVVNPVTHMTLAEQLEQETPALVRWYDEEKRDDDGHPVHYDDIEKIPEGAKTTMGAFCSAVWVSQDVMLTAAHCVDDIGKPADDSSDEDPTKQLRRLLQMLQNGQDPREEPKWDPTGQTVHYSVRGDITPKTKAFHSAKVLAVDWNNDISLLTADSPGVHPFAPLRQDPIHDGEELHIVGHPAGMWWTYVHGYVAAQRPEYEDHAGHKYPVIQVTAPIWFGNSGGGAYDVDGNLVGMADSISRVPNTAYFIPNTTIRAFMEHNKVVPPQR